MGEKPNTGIGAAIGRIPSGCMVLTAKHGQQSTGILVSWVQQASFEPPAITVCVKKLRPIEQLIDDSAHFVVNVIGQDAGAYLRHFKETFPLEKPAFEGIKHHAAEAGIVLDDCIGHMCCKVIAKYESGDHWLYVGKVIDGHGNPNAQPHVHLRKSGMNY